MLTEKYPKTIMVIKAAMCAIKKGYVTSIAFNDIEIGRIKNNNNCTRENIAIKKRPDPYFDS